MMSTRHPKFLLWFAALALVLACVPSMATPFPTVNPDQIDQFIAQTANAAKTRTAAALPTSTGTATVTPTLATFTPSPTATATVIFVLENPTLPATATETFTLGGGGTSEEDFACEVISVSPSDGAGMEGRQSFDATWRVRNIGQKKWNEGAVSYFYQAGELMHTQASYPLTSDVRQGATVNIVVPMVAPRNSGTYTTVWALGRGGDSFCEMHLRITVR